MTGNKQPFIGKIGRTIAESTPHWPPAAKAPAGAPNILVVLFDDIGFSDFGCYGSPIETPTIDRLAAEGLRYTGLHTTAMCSTTRAALLTGRNHHSVGVGCLANFDSGYPGYRGKISARGRHHRRDAAPPRLSQLHGRQVARDAVDRGGSTGPFDGWPLAAASIATMASWMPRPTSTRPNSCSTTRTSIRPARSRPAIT